MDVSTHPRKYKVENNTDFGRRYFDNYEDALTAWENVAPCPDAGNRYFASWAVLCATCGEYSDVLSEAQTCSCADRR